MDDDVGNEILRRLQLLDHKINQMWSFVIFAGSIGIFFGFDYVFQLELPESVAILGGLFFAALAWWTLNLDFRKADP